MPIYNFYDHIMVSRQKKPCINIGMQNIVYAHWEWKGDIIMIKWTQKWIMEKAGQASQQNVSMYCSSFSVTSYYPGNWFFFSCPLYAFQDQSEGIRMKTTKQQSRKLFLPTLTSSIWILESFVQSGSVRGDY